MNEFSTETAVGLLAVVLAILIIVAIGWWAFTFSTHTLVWLAFMGFTLGSFEQNSLIRRCMRRK